MLLRRHTKVRGRAFKQLWQHEYLSKKFVRSAKPIRQRTEPSDLSQVQGEKQFEPEFVIAPKQHATATKASFYLWETSTRQIGFLALERTVWASSLVFTVGYIDLCP
jgi:hypothetical protein